MAAFPAAALFGIPQELITVIAGGVTLVVIVVVGLLRKTRWAERLGFDREDLPFRCPTHPVIEAPVGLRAMPGGSPMAAVRALMGPVPRSFPAKLEGYLAVLPPGWLKAQKEDAMWENLRNQERLRREGRVVWGTIVQANNKAYQRVSAEVGASVIYSADPFFDENREALGEMARACYGLKGTDPADPEEAAMARMLTSEVMRGMRLKVPRTITGGREVYHSAMFLPRKHLPQGYLAGGYFPVWMDGEATGAVVMVPAAYWPASMLGEWDREARG